MSCIRCLAALGIWTVLVAVAAAAPMKALIVDGQNNHNWKETTPHLKKLLEETGLFTVDVATTPGKGQDMSGFKPDFAAYDLVVSNYTGDAWPEETNQAFEKYVAGGGGVVIFHAASNAFPNWKEFNEIIGVGGWGGRNEKHGPYLYWKDGKIVRDTSPGRGGTHGPQHPFQLIVRVPDHPITKGLPEVSMHSADELYSRLRGPAKNLTVLATAFAAKEKRGTGNHEPMLMTIRYGKGRVFHTALGHAGKQCRSVAFIVTYQRGAEWAATGKVTQKIPDDFPGSDEPSVRE
jgi:type 1 glutamine amidotransferase